MKAKNLILGLVVVLGLALALPGAVLATDTTEVTGNVVQGYNFIAPAGIGLGEMTLGQENRASSTGELSGNHPSGYTVKGEDTKEGDDRGYMVSGDDVLYNPLMLSDDGVTYTAAYWETTFLETTEPGTDAVPFYVSQYVLFDDPLGDYSITITFTVTENTP